MLFFLALYMQEVMYYSPARADLAWLPFCAAVIGGFGTAAGTAPKLGARPLGPLLPHQIRDLRGMQSACFPC